MQVQPIVSHVLWSRGEWNGHASGAKIAGARRSSTSMVITRVRRVQCISATRPAERTRPVHGQLLFITTKLFFKLLSELVAISIHTSTPAKSDSIFVAVPNDDFRLSVMCFTFRSSLDAVITAHFPRVFLAALLARTILVPPARDTLGFKGIAPLFVRLPVCLLMSLAAVARDLASTAPHQQFAVGGLVGLADHAGAVDFSCSRHG